MRVAHYCSVFSVLSESFLYDYVTELERQGVENHVLTHRRLNAADRPFGRVRVLPWPGRFNALRLSYRLLELTGRRERGTSGWPQVRRALREALRRLQPDVLHAHFGPQGVVAAPAAAALGVPLVVTFYGYDISQLARQARWQQAYARLWEAAAAVTVLSEDMRTQAEALGCPPAKLRVVHLSRDLHRFAYRPPEGAVRQLVSVGRLVEKKGHADAVRVVDQVRTAGREVRLRIIGGGPLREALGQEIRRRGLQAAVTLVGALPNAAVAGALRAADAFLLCSKTAPDGDREGTPTVLVEAQAVGLPCLSTRHAGIPEMIPKENHDLLAPEGDTEALAAALERLLAETDAQRRARAEAGRAHVESTFSLAREVETLRQMYRQVSR